MDPEDFTATPDVETWRAEWRHQWATQAQQHAELMEALEGGGIMSALDDLTAAVAGQEEVGNRVAALVDTLQAQVGDLTQAIADLQAQTGADLQPLTDRIAAITAELTAAEAPPASEEPAPEEPPVEG